MKRKVYTLKLIDFMKKYPSYGYIFLPYLSDPEYIVKFNFNDNNEIYLVELGYIEDEFHIDNIA